MTTAHDDAAVHLEAAASIVALWMADGPDKVDVLRRLGLQIAVLRRQDAARVCRRCRESFVMPARAVAVVVAHFLAQHFQLGQVFAPALHA